MVASNDDNRELLREIVAHFRDNQDALKKRWMSVVKERGFLASIPREEADAAAGRVYRAFVTCLESGDYEPVRTYAASIAERSLLSGITSEQVVNGFLALRDIFARGLFHKYGHEPERLEKALDVYEPIASNILAIVALAFVEERERVVRQQQEAIRELSTPVLRVRDRLLILPIIGVIDTQRARQLTEELLKAIRVNRAKVVIMDITGVASVDTKVANHIIQTVSAARLLGATVILSGVAPEIAQTVVTIGVDLSKIHTVCDLQSGLEEADRLLGYRVVTEPPR